MLPEIVLRVVPPVVETVENGTNVTVVFPAQRA